MMLLLGHNSAWHFWRNIYPTDRSPHGQAKPLPASTDLVPCERLINTLPSWARDANEGAPNEVHLIVRRAQDRRTLPAVQCHIWNADSASSACFKLSSTVRVVSPALAFLMAASVLSFSQLVAYGDELCGYYSFYAERRQDEQRSLVAQHESNGPNKPCTHDSCHLHGAQEGQVAQGTPSNQGFRMRSQPLLTKKQLQSFLACTPRAHGLALAKQACEQVVERAASPMETTVEMLLSLPYRYGGYGIPTPRMNWGIKLDERSQAIAHKGRCFGDLCYPDKKLIIEYHGREYHNNEVGFLGDRRRINGLRDAGYDVIELTSDQVFDFDTFEAVACSIAKKLGKRIRSRDCGPLPQRVALRKEMFEWNRTFGAMPGDCRPA